MHYGVKYTVTDSACDQWRAPTSHWNLPSGVNSLNRERSVDISVVKNDTPGWYLLMDSLLLHLVTFNMQVMLLIFTVNHCRISDWMVAHTLSAKLLVDHWMGNVILVFSFLSALWVYKELHIPVFHKRWHFAHLWFISSRGEGYGTSEYASHKEEHIYMAPFWWIKHNTRTKTWGSLTNEWIWSTY